MHLKEHTGFLLFLATCDLWLASYRLATCDLRLATCTLRLALLNLPYDYTIVGRGKNNYGFTRRERLGVGPGKGRPLFVFT